MYMYSVAHDEITFYLPAAVVMLYKQLIDIISTPTQILLHTRIMSLLLPAVLFYNAMLQLHGGSSYHQITLLLKLLLIKKGDMAPNRKAVLLWSRYVFVGVYGEKKFTTPDRTPAFASYFATFFTRSTSDGLNSNMVQIGSTKVNLSFGSSAIINLYMH